MRIKDKIVYGYSFRNAVDVARAAGVASTPEGVSTAICAELAAMGRPGACRGVAAQQESPYVEQDAALLLDPRGPEIKEGQFGADARAWKCLHLRALDGILDEAYLDFFGRRISCTTCQKHWYKVIEASPFMPGAGFTWACYCHNAVNHSLGIGDMTEERAREIWSQVR